MEGLRDRGFPQINLRFYSFIRYKNILVLFGIIKHLIANFSGDRKFMVSLDMNYDPPLRVGFTSRENIKLIY